MDRPRLPIALAAIQGIAVAIALAGAPLVPPAEGRILLAPITSMTAGSIVTLARRQDAAIIGTGPWAGSIVVAGRRDVLFPAMARAGILTLAAPEAACGETRA